MIHEVCRLGLLDSLPIEFDATREGPRSISWRSDAPCELKWVEALDKGDPKNNPDVQPRDAVFLLDFAKPLEGQAPRRVAATGFRCAPFFPLGQVESHFGLFLDVSGKPLEGQASRPRAPFTRTWHST